MTTDLKKKVSLTVCADPLSGKRVREVYSLADELREIGLEVNMVPGFFGNEMTGPEEKAGLVSACFRDPEMDFIFDVSGGDLSNLVLPYLDYEAIARSRALFCGYSDLTTVLNAVQAKTGRETANYQVRNILYSHADEQKEYLLKTVLTGRISEDDLECRFLRGSRMSGKILGGNLRCFLKLAGTPFWADMNGGVLLLESLGGTAYQIMTAIAQYGQAGVFEKISGVLLGTFTKMEREGLKPTAQELILRYVPGNIPVAVTPYIGHGDDARAVVIGKEYMLKSHEE